MFLCQLAAQFRRDLHWQDHTECGGIGRIGREVAYGLSLCEVLFLRTVRSRAILTRMARSSSSSSKPVKSAQKPRKAYQTPSLIASEKAPAEGQVTVSVVPKFKNLNQRQEVFCQHIAAGLSGVEAFKRVTPGSPRDCDVKAAQMRRKPGVEERIRELMRENDKRATLSRQQALKWLTRVILTGAGDVGPHDSLCQSHKYTSGDGLGVSRSEGSR